MKILTKSRPKPVQGEKILCIAVPNAESSTVWSFGNLIYNFLVHQAGVYSRTINYSLDSVTPHDILESLLRLTKGELMCDHISNSHTLGTKKLHS